MNPDIKVAFVGGGNMGRALLGALRDRGHPAAKLAVGEAHEATRTALLRDFPGVAVGADNPAAIDGAGLVVLALKPQEMAPVVTALQPALQRSRPVVLSIAAGIAFQTVLGNVFAGIVILARDLFLQDAFQVVFLDAVTPLEGQRLVVGHPQKVDIGLVDELAAAVGSRDPEQHRGAVGQGAEARIALADLFKGQPAFGDVDVDAGGPHDAASPVLQHFTARQQPADLSVRPHDPILGRGHLAGPDGRYVALSHPLLIVGMDARTLKERFGDKLTFWGGGVDTQKTLPFGTPEQVRAEVLERIEIFGRGGGFVFNTVHNVQSRTPAENLVAMYEAVREARSGGKLAAK